MVDPLCPDLKHMDSFLSKITFWWDSINSGYLQLTEANSHLFLKPISILCISPLYRAQRLVENILTRYWEELNVKDTRRNCQNVYMNKWKMSSVQRENQLQGLYVLTVSTNIVRKKIRSITSIWAANHLDSLNRDNPWSNLATIRQRHCNFVIVVVEWIQVY